MKPREIAGAAAFGNQDEPLRNLVGVQRLDAGFDCVQVPGIGFDQEQVFRAFGGSPVPVVDGVDAGHDVDAGNKLTVNESAGDSLCLDERAGCGQGNTGRSGFRCGHAAHSKRRMA